MEDWDPSSHCGTRDYLCGEYVLRQSIVNFVKQYGGFREKLSTTTMVFTAFAKYTTYIPALPVIGFPIYANFS